MGAGYSSPWVSLKQGLGLLKGQHSAPEETRGHLLKGTGCWLRWLAAVQGAGPRLLASSQCSWQTQLLPHPCPEPARGARDRCHMALMCTQHLGTQCATSACPGVCLASRGHSTLQMSAPFGKERGGGPQVPVRGMGPHHGLSHG